MMSQADISKLEGINRSTLTDWYKKTGNMIEAVKGAKESQEQRNIDYNGEVLSLSYIRKRKQEIKELDETCDIINIGVELYVLSCITNKRY